MSGSHSNHQEPNAMSNGFVRLTIIVVLALLASLLWNSCGTSLHSAGAGHGDGHGTTAHGTEGTHEAKHEASHDHAVMPAGRLDSVTNDFIYDEGKLTGIELPDGGGKMQAGEHSTEVKLFNFLSNKTLMLDTVKGNWFELTNVRFKTGGTVIDSSSLVQIKNIAAICKAFPAVKFKVGGYTDNSGDTTKNIALSQRRAEAVLAAFTAAGVSNAAFTDAKGYGPEHPIGDNVTAEGRAMNRRVAVNVKAK